MLRRLDNRVLLGMQSPTEFVALTGNDTEPFPHAADFHAMGDSGRRPVVTGSKDIPVLDDYGAHFSSHAGGTPRHKMRDFHEVFIPGWSCHIPFAFRLSAGRYL
jgi:hypothetical protein